jgi:hypothetical protein
LLHLIGGKLEHIFWVGNKQLPKLIAWADDLSRDSQAKNIARLHKALDAFTAIDPATLPSSDRADREMLIGSIKGKLLGVETIRYWQKDPGVYVRSATSAKRHIQRTSFPQYRARRSAALPISGCLDAIACSAAMP